LGVFNSSALAAADYAITAAGQLGLKLQIPLTDNYHYYHGGKHCFTDWLGIPESEFYTNETAIAAFKEYIYQRLTHVNSFTKIAAKDDPAIMVWETGNELQAPSAWTAEIAAYIKSIAPNQLVMDGNYGINVDSLNISDVDLYSDHFYPVDPARLAQDLALVSTADKAFVVGEFGWVQGDVAAFIQQMQASTVAYDAYWSLFPHLDTYGFEQHNDGFTLHFPGDNSGMAAMVQTLTSHARFMSNTSIPSNYAPGIPIITSLATTNVEWRGGNGAANYSIETANASSGPFNILCNWCVTDNGSPYTFAPPLQAGVYVRMRGQSTTGATGPYSPVQTVQTD
jgi:mannan endo-1,4-beta-mannosidase